MKPPCSPKLGEGSKSPVPLLPAWEKGLGDEGEDLDINKSAFLSSISDGCYNLVQFIDRIAS
ncbi:MAG: hypothetical protein LH702_26565 [Phormidesmis sp. CAN_BIN44]|nr:hypothetical protein [Phormidesmis sp. CAN_BIN44]